MSGLAKGLTEDQVLRRVVEKVCEQVWSQDEALKLALEALDIVKIHFTQNRHVNEAITAIKEALAQPEHIGFMDSKLNPIQRTWVGLTEEDLKLLSAEWRIVYGAWMDDFAKDIEAKLKQKNI